MHVQTVNTRPLSTYESAKASSGIATEVQGEFAFSHPTPPLTLKDKS